MISKPFLVKDDQRLPDNYGIAIWFIDGRKLELNVVKHRYINIHGLEVFFEVLTLEDEWNAFSMKQIIRLQFDKRFSTIVDLEQQKKEKENKENEK